MNENGTTPDAGERRRIPWLLIPALAVIAAFAVRTIARSDFWMHLATGRWIVAHGIPHGDVFSYTTLPDKPWINGSWLYDVVLYGLWQAGGAPFVVLVHAALAVAAFLCLIPVARKRAGSLGLALGLVLCGWLLAPSLDATPSTFCLVFPALFILVLDSRISAPRAAFMLVPAQIIWTNCSESSVLGPLLAAAFAIESRARASRPTEPGSVPARDWLPIAMLAVALALSSQANPYRTELWQYVLRSAADVRYHPMMEWTLFNAHFIWTPWNHLVTASLILFAAGFVSYHGRLPLALTMTTVICAFVMVRSPRFMEMCAILSFPFICLSFSALGELVTPRIRRHAPGLSGAFEGVALSITLFVALASVAAGMGNYYYNRAGSAAAFGWQVQRDLFPSDRALDAVDAIGTNRVVNIPIDGDYLAWQRPDRQVFADSRSSLYGAAFYQQMQRALLGDTNAWYGVVAKWQPGGIMLNCTWPGASMAIHQLLVSGHWRLGYFDGLTAVLAEPVSANRKLFADTELRQAGLRALEDAHEAYRSRVEGGACCTPNPAPLIGAAFVFQSMNRLHEADTLFEILTRGAPTMIVGYVNRGICLVQLGRFDEAVGALEYASRRMPRDLYVWVWLSKAYRGAGRSADADHAEAMARSMNKQLADRLLSGAPNGTGSGLAQPAPVTSDYPPATEPTDAMTAPEPASER